MDLKLFAKKSKKEKCKKKCVRDKIEEAFVALDEVKSEVNTVFCDVTEELGEEDECGQKHERKTS